MLSTKRKLILEREKKAGSLDGRTRRAKVASAPCEELEEVREKKKDADPRTRGRQAPSRHSRTDEEKLCVYCGRAADRGPGDVKPNLGLNLRRRSRHRMPGLVCCVCCVLLTACSQLLLRPAATATAAGAAAAATAAATVTVHTTR